MGMDSIRRLLKAAVVDEPEGAKGIAQKSVQVHEKIGAILEKIRT